MVRRSGKLYYSLWHPTLPATPEDPEKEIEMAVVANRGSGEAAGPERSGRAFKKEELRKGKDRNNFCIILDNS